MGSDAMADPERLLVWARAGQPEAAGQLLELFRNSPPVTLWCPFGTVGMSEDLALRWRPYRSRPRAYSRLWRGPAWCVVRGPELDGTSAAAW